MNEFHDSIEEELSSLRPHDVSPELRRRIAERLAEPVPARRQRSWTTALAWSVAAACLAAFFWPWSDGQNVERQPGSNGRQPNAVVATGGSQPTLLAYQRALNRSPEELDALLNSHAHVKPDRNPELVRIGAFTRSDAALHALLGDD